MSHVVERVRRSGWWPAIPSAIVIIVSVATVAGRTWVLTGDFSFTEFLVRAIPAHPPLIGVAGRVVDSGSHPGPSMAYLLWPGYRLLGSNAFALAASAALLHITAIAAVVVLARRIGGTYASAALGGGLLVLVVSFAPRFFLEPWNVWIPVFAFALFLVLLWGLVLERLAMLPWAVAVGSHCVQSHVSYAVIVAGSMGLVSLWLGWCWWRTDRLDGRHPLRWLVVGVVTLFVAWLPPIVDQLRPGEGNFRKLYREFSSPSKPYIGIRAALKSMVGRFNLLGPWLRSPGTDPRSAPNLVGFLLFVALVGGALWCAWRRRSRVELALYAVLGAATALGALSTMRIYGPFFEYVVRFMLPLVALWVGASLWSIALTLKERPLPRVPVATAIAAVVAALLVVGVVKAAGAQVPYRRDVAITAALSRSTRSALDKHLRYQINEMDPVSIGAPGFGLALDLDHHGWKAGVGPWGAAGAMQYRVVTDDRADAALWYIASARLIDAFAAIPGSRVVARFDVRSAAEAAHTDALEADIIRQLCALGGERMAETMYIRWGETQLFFDPAMPSALKDQLFEFNTIRQPAAVVELPPGDPQLDVSAPVTGLCP